MALLFMLLGAVYLHSLPGLSAQLGLPLDPSTGLTPWGWDLRGVSLEHILVSLGVMAVPGTLVGRGGGAGHRMVREGRHAWRGVGSH